MAGDPGPQRLPAKAARSQAWRGSRRGLDRPLRMGDAEALGISRCEGLDTARRMGYGRASGGASRQGLRTASFGNLGGPHDQWA